MRRQRLPAVDADALRADIDATLDALLGRASDARAPRGVLDTSTVIRLGEISDPLLPGRASDHS